LTCEIFVGVSLFIASMTPTDGLISRLNFSFARRFDGRYTLITNCSNNSRKLSVPPVVDDIFQPPGEQSAVFNNVGGIYGVL